MNAKIKLDWLNAVRLKIVTIMLLVCSVFCNPLYAQPEQQLQLLPEYLVNGGSSSTTFRGVLELDFLSEWRDENCDDEGAACLDKIMSSLNEIYKKNLIDNLNIKIYRLKGPSFTGISHIFAIAEYHGVFSPLYIANELSSNSESIKYKARRVSSFNSQQFWLEVEETRTQGFQSNTHLTRQVSWLGYVFELNSQKELEYKVYKIPVLEKVEEFDFPNAPDKVVVISKHQIDVSFPKSNTIKIKNRTQVISDNQSKWLGEYVY